MPKHTRTTSPEGDETPHKKPKATNTAPNITTKTCRYDGPAMEVPPLSNEQKAVYNTLLDGLGDIDRDQLNKTTSLRTKMRISALIGLLTVMDPEMLKGMATRNAAYIVELYGYTAESLLNRWIKSGTMQQRTQRAKCTTDAQRAVRAWYGEVCILTNVKKPTEAAHAIPNVIERSKWGLQSFLAGLSIFFSPTDHERWRTILLDPKHEETNLVMLRKDIHDLWDDALFCLEPREVQEERPTTLELQFFWLHGKQGKATTLSYENPSPSNYKIEHPTAGRPVRSGDSFILMTGDVEASPLPNTHLLRLQCLLHKALRISASDTFLHRVLERESGVGSLVTASGQDTPDGDSRQLGTSQVDGGDDSESEGVGSPGDNDYAPLNVPYFAEYLLEQAARSGIVKRDELPYWRRTIDPSCANPDRPLGSEEGTEESTEIDDDGSK
ncbi:hypothetical protein CONLIGDRAFT_635321 [Coniochaeta ligniaria NRRL 30616]|uniref:HNH nuclease domain-containing protein n=1 Tax=Coniochaeta ligniaria NRRL 30616 TaxID=1408157 RepID=A0A1J7II47_9PEZI|nr:hypothetical protein CONLIGDRAFT_635321 [Coniochaeta ligniaria NRRL 30616]